jgi:photosystem II stability/assembly factor-like uncharacterized protein
VIIGAASAPGGPQKVAWLSDDQGRTWRRVEHVLAGDSQLYALVYANDQFVLLGSSTGELRSPAAVFASPDGERWTRVDAPGVRHLSEAIALPNGHLLAVAGNGVNSERPDEYCAVAWLWDGARWQAEEMGCHGIPESLVVLRDGRVAAVYGSTLYLRT